MTTFLQGGRYVISVNMTVALIVLETESARSNKIRSIQHYSIDSTVVTSKYT